MLHWIGTHWLLSSAGIGLVALIVFAPAVAAAVGRWLIGTEIGRYLLLAAIVVFAGKYAWDARFSAGRAAGLAACQAERAAANEQTAKQVGKGEDANADATKGARDAADARQPIQQARAAKVKGYADSAPDRCAGSPDIVRELREGTDRVRSSENRLRGNGRPEGAPAGAADH
jgi:hypothetical protein